MFSGDDSSTASYLVGAQYHGVLLKLRQNSRHYEMDLSRITWKRHVLVQTVHNIEHGVAKPPRARIDEFCCGSVGTMTRRVRLTVEREFS